MNKINDEKRKKDHGLTLAEKIEKLIEKVKKKDVVEHIDDSFYSETVEQGVVFYIRKTNLQREGGRTKEVVDEIEVADLKKIEEDKIEAARDMEYEEFKAKFEDHILGKAANERDVGSDNEEDEGPNASKGAELKSHMTGRSSSQAQSRQGLSASRASGMRSTKSNATGVNDLYKHDIPKSCHMMMMKKVKIEKLEEKFLLVSHPFPQIPGELMIFRPRSEDKDEKDQIVYRDYSLRKRLATSEKGATSVIDQLNKKKKKNELDLQKL